MADFFLADQLTCQVISELNKHDSNVFASHIMSI